MRERKQTVDVWEEGAEESRMEKTLKILLKEELHNLYSAKSKLEGWNGRKCSTHGTKLVAVYIFRCQCLCTECKGQ